MGYMRFILQHIAYYSIRTRTRLFKLHTHTHYKKVKHTYTHIQIYEHTHILIYIKSYVCTRAHFDIAIAVLSALNVCASHTAGYCFVSNRPIGLRNMTFIEPKILFCRGNIINIRNYLHAVTISYYYYSLRVFT